jgi:hypothetical protein
MGAKMGAISGAHSARLACCMVQKTDSVNGQKAEIINGQKTDGMVQKADGMVQKTDSINGQNPDSRLSVLMMMVSTLIFYYFSKDSLVPGCAKLVFG